MDSEEIGLTVILIIEVAGTAGAFASSSAISRWGNNYSFFLTPGTGFRRRVSAFTLTRLDYPVFFALSAGIWILISTLNHPSTQKQETGLSEVERPERKSNYVVSLIQGVRGFAESVWVGAWLVCSSRRFICECSPSFYQKIMQKVNDWIGLVPS